MPMTLRTLSRNDLEQLVLVEQSVQLAPWTRETFLACFESGYTGWVIENTKRLVGFILVSHHMGECHILNLCVLREHQHRGHGTELLNKALSAAKELGAGVAYLEVR